MQLHGKKIWTFLAIFMMVATLLSFYGTASAAPKTSPVSTFALHQRNPDTPTIGVEKTAKEPPYKYKCEKPTSPTNLDELSFGDKMVQSGRIEPKLKLVNRPNQALNKQKTKGLAMPNEWAIYPGIWIHSDNWAGYYRTGLQPFRSDLSFQKVSAKWQVPQVLEGTILPSQTTTWVGLGGEGDDPFRPGYKEVLYQAGSNSWSVGGKISYNLWFEIFRQDKSPVPGTVDAVTVNEVPVNAGDQVYVQVWLNPKYNHNGNNVQVNFYLYNVTQKKDCNIHIEYKDILSTPGPTTAEWIVERGKLGISGRGYLLPLAKFSTVSFTEAGYSEQWDGPQKLLPAYDSNNLNVQIIMHNDKKNYDLATPSDIVKDGEFTVTWKNSS